MDKDSVPKLEEVPPVAKCRRLNEESTQSDTKNAMDSEGDSYTIIADSNDIPSTMTVSTSEEALQMRRDSQNKNDMDLREQEPWSPEQYDKAASGEMDDNDYNALMHQDDEEMPCIDEDNAEVSTTATTGSTSCSSFAGEEMDVGAANTSANNSSLCDATVQETAMDDAHPSKDMFEHQDFGEEYLKNRDMNLTEEEIQIQLGVAQEIKTNANRLFKAQKYEEAINRYTDALNICPLRASEDRAILFSNRAAAKLYTGQVEEALVDCNKSLDLDPSYLRAIARRASVYEKLERYEDALQDFEKVLQLDPKNNAALEAQQRIPGLVKDRDERLKAELMGKLKDLGNMILKPFGLSTDNFSLQQDPATGSYSVSMKK